jgi:hypothetical protein
MHAQARPFMELALLLRCAQLARARSETESLAKLLAASRYGNGSHSAADDMPGHQAEVWFYMSCVLMYVRACVYVYTCMLVHISA